LTYVPVALMDQNLLGESAEAIEKTLQSWQDAAAKHGAGLVLATHWRFFGPGASIFPETALFGPWKSGLLQFLKQGKP
jgi:hypothetical protein